MNYEFRAGISDVPVFFIHGNIASSRWWSPMVEILSDNFSSSGAKDSAPFILAEWTGFGKAAPAKTESELHPQFLANKFLNWIDEQGIEKLQVVGHSAGGLIAQYMMIIRPELFERGVLIGSVGLNGLRLKADSIDRFEQLKQDKEFLKATLAFTIYRKDKELYEVCPHFDELVAHALKTHELNWTGVVRQFSDLDISHELQSLDVPLLLLHGIHDSVIPIDEARTIAKTAPRAELIELPDNGHNPFVENPSEVASLIAQFLKNH